MAMINSINLSGSSSSGESDVPSGEEQKRLSKQPSGPRKESSNSSSESDGEHAVPANVPQPKRASGEPSASRKVKMTVKRSLDEVAGQEDAPAKKKSALKKADTGEKSSPLKKFDTAEKSSPLKKFDTAEKSSPLKKFDAAEKPSHLKKSDAAEKPSHLKKSDTAEKPSHLKKSDTTEKPSPPRRHESVSQGTAEETLGKSAKEKKQKKKSRRRQQIVQEAAASTPVKVSTPVKKVQHLWSDKDEMVFVNALLASSKRGMDLSKVLAQVHQDLKDAMDYEYTKGQLYEKLRRLKNKYFTVLQKLKEGNEEEDSYPFKTPHDKAMFRMCHQLWQMEEAPTKDAGTPVDPELPTKQGDANDNPGSSSREREDKKDGGTLEEENKKDEGTREEEDKKDGGRTVGAQQGAQVEAAQTSRQASRHASPVEAAQASRPASPEKLDTFVREDVPRGDGGIRGSQAAFSIINREVMDGILGVRGLPFLNAARAEELEHKWCEQNIVEMEALDSRLNLLKEECSLCLEALKSSGGRARS